jgi:subtilisin family serine protease
MKKTLFVLGLSFFLAAHFSTPLLAATPASRFVVLFKNDQIPVDAAHLIGAAGGRIVKIFPSVGIVIATSGNPDFESSLAFSTPVEAVSSARFRPLPGGATLSAGVVTPADDFFSFQWNIRRVKADKAWKITRGTHKTTVAVIDTGVAWNHPDLTKNVVYAACFTSLGSCAWKSPVETCPCTPYPDLNPHGTAVASVIAASSAGGRMVGVGPGLGIASYNVFELIAPDGIPQEFSYDDSVWSAMFDAAERGYRVMNISLGDPLFDRTDDKTIIAAWTRVVKEILSKNVTIVASAGNNGLKLTGQTVHIPSDLPGVISVGATGIRPEPRYPFKESFDVAAFYSNFGRPIDLVAPGGDYGADDLSNVPPNWYEFGVLSAFVCPGCSFTADSSPVLGYTSLDADPGCIANASCQTDYTWFIGTSLAAPHVSAVAGLIIDRFPYFNNVFVTTILKTSAERLGDHPHFGSGMVDAYRAVGGR